MKKLKSLALAGSLTFATGCSTLTDVGGESNPEKTTPVTAEDSAVAQEFPTECNPITDLVVADSVSGVLAVPPGESDNADEFYEKRLKELSELQGRELSWDDVITDLAGCALNGNPAFIVSDDQLALITDPPEIPSVHVSGTVYERTIDEQCIVTALAGTLDADALAEGMLRDFQPDVIKNLDHQIIEVMCVNNEGL